MDGEQDLQDAQRQLQDDEEYEQWLDQMNKQWPNGLNFTATYNQKRNLK